MKPARLKWARNHAGTGTAYTAASLIKWMDHIDAMDQCATAYHCGLTAKDPLVEYRYEAYEAFQAMVYSIKEDVVRFILRVKVVKEPEQHKAVAYSGSNQRTTASRTAKWGAINCPAAAARVQAVLWKRSRVMSLAAWRGICLCFINTWTCSRVATLACIKALKLLTLRQSQTQINHRKPPVVL